MVPYTCKGCYLKFQLCVSKAILVLLEAGASALHVGKLNRPYGHESSLDIVVYKIHGCHHHGPSPINLLLESSG